MSYSSFLLAETFILDRSKALTLEKPVLELNYMSFCYMYLAFGCIFFAVRFFGLRLVSSEASVGESAGTIIWMV